MTVGQPYQIDLDPVHAVIRLTITEEIVTQELADDIYKRLTQISSKGGPYATIHDLTIVKGSTIPKPASAIEKRLSNCEPSCQPRRRFKKNSLCLLARIYDPFFSLAL